MASATVVAVSCVAIGCFLRAARKVWTRQFQQEAHPQQWKKRPAALTAVQMSMASLFFFIWAYASGGPQLKVSLPVFIGLVLATGVLSIFNMYFRIHLQGLKGVTLATPIEALVPLGAVIISPLFGNDLPLNAWGVAGVACMAAGMYGLELQKTLLSTEDRSEAPLGARWIAPFVLLRRNPAAWAACMIVLLGAIGVHLDARLARHANIPWALAWVFSISAIGNCITAIRRQQFKGLNLRQILWAALPGTLFALGNGITNYAYRLANTAYVAALKRGDVILAQIGGRVINREREAFINRLISGLLIACGATLIAFAI